MLAVFGHLGMFAVMPIGVQHNVLYRIFSFVYSISVQGFTSIAAGVR
jgi:hypothetical protein